MEVVGFAFVLLVALAAGVAARYSVRRSVSIASPGGGEETAAPSQQADARDMLRKTGMLLQPGAETQAAIRLRLIRAGLNVDPVTWRGIQAVSVLASLAVALWLVAFLRLESYPLLIALGACVLAGAGGPALYLASKTRERRKRIAHALPGALELLNTAVRAGYTIERGIRLVGNAESGPLADEFRRVDREINMLSMPFDKALLRMKERCDTPSIDLFANAMVQAQQQGTSVARTLDAQAKAARSQHYTDLLVTINQLPNKMVPIIFVVFFPVIIALSVVPVAYNTITQLSTIA